MFLSLQPTSGRASFLNKPKLIPVQTLSKDCIRVKFVIKPSCRLFKENLSCLIFLFYKMPSGKKLTREEELLLQDFSRNVSTKSSALFYGNAFIISAVPICKCLLRIRFYFSKIYYHMYTFSSLIIFNYFLSIILHYGEFITVLENRTLDLHFK